MVGMCSKNWVSVATITVTGADLVGQAQQTVTIAQNGEQRIDWQIVPEIRPDSGIPSRFQAWSDNKLEREVCRCARNTFAQAQSA